MLYLFIVWFISYLFQIIPFFGGQVASKTPDGRREVKDFPFVCTLWPKLWEVLVLKTRAGEESECCWWSLQRAGPHNRSAAPSPPKKTDALQPLYGPSRTTCGKRRVKKRHEGRVLRHGALAAGSLLVGHGHGCCVGGRRLLPHPPTACTHTHASWRNPSSCIWFKVRCSWWQLTTLRPGSGGIFTCDSTRDAEKEEKLWMGEEWKLRIFLHFNLQYWCSSQQHSTLQGPAQNTINPNIFFFPLSYYTWIISWF